MKLFFVLNLILGMMLFAQNQKDTLNTNPFFTEWTTPFKTPPFNLIRSEHYMPAFIRGMEEQKKEIDAITANTQPPTFQNTIEVYEHSGTLLTKVMSVFSGLRSANTNDELEKIANESTPLLTKHRTDISLNEKLFQRIKSVYEQRKKFRLTDEQSKLLENIYKDFVRGGANLPPEKKKRLREINEELSILTLKFNQNVLKETNNFKLIIEKKEDLAGLSQTIIDGAAETAKKSGLEGKWIFTLQKPSFIPFLQYAQNRQLREQIFKGYINRGDNNNEYDNKSNASKIAALRVERANLLGYKTHADYVLEENMAKTTKAVNDFLKKLWTPALKAAKHERDEMQRIINDEGGKFKLEAWDWWYYAEKLRKQKYDLDENELRPYFQLDNVRNGAFEVASKLFGIQFVERKDIPAYSDDMKVFEVLRFDSSHVGILYTDYLPRTGKRPGAWANSYRKQERIDGKLITPIVQNTGNFSKPTSDMPSLLSLDEVETLFHEFGHALHALLSNCTYASLSGTAVARDFVELPSQIMENWAFEPEVLRMYAKHYKTGEPIPEALVEKLQNSQKFNQGFATVEYLAAAILDMDWHTLKDTIQRESNAFEKKSLDKIQLMPEIVVRYRSPYFAHIFSGGYSSGYYSYIWAEVLDADAFQTFKEKGLFDSKTAEFFKKNILERGGTDDPMKLYEKFQGRKPLIEPLLKKRGLM